MSSLILPTKRGAGVKDVSIQPVFTMEFKGVDLEQYHIVGTDLSWGEADATSVVQTVGGDIFMYCTGAQPVALTMSAMVIYPPGTCQSKKGKFRDFWSAYRIGTYKKLLTVVLDEQAFRLALTNYTRMPTAQEADLDITRLSFIGVATNA